MNTRDQNLDLIKQEAVNSGNVIYRSTITVSGSVQQLTTDLATMVSAGLGSPKRASFSVVSDEPDAVVARYTQEGTTPIATTIGEPTYNKDKFEISGLYNLQRFKIIQEAANTTTIEITYYK